MKHQFIKRTALFVALAACGITAQAADWSDTSIGYRYGNNFSEPYTASGISKSIINLEHVDGYKYGTNFFNIDMLISDSKDPAGGDPGATGAQEAYVVYRHMLDLGKVSGKSLAIGPIRGFGLTAGFDWNTKNDEYASKKQMLVIGPTIMVDVPGFLNISVLALRESNAPGSIPRYYYDTHTALDVAWGIPIASTGLSFEGYADYIGAKGLNEYGGATAPETHVDAKLMYDVSPFVGAAKKTFKVGFEYELWVNKFGNPSTGGSGSFAGAPYATASTPMIRAEYHF